ncbi:uncharacterized protein C8A04DRAFT_30900 [Dichotomopilus funicola]|uniref:Cyanovirin-N domain-containing protein n=1 Tax=Dichotomopilus funicola TaxID=1934379 RepID=A0AAN6ZJG8_9PEZI|nr:hypothetical protein C8A04DRAFT_30900 [Dichotomopilus funicola]
MKSCSTWMFLTFLLPSVVVAWGGFYQTCKENWNIVNDRFMTAQCTTRSGGVIWSSLDLNLCLQNDHGDMIPTAGGNKEKSFIPWGCGFCDQGQGIIPKTRPPTSYLECVCRKPPMDGTAWNWTRIDLNEFIVNESGILSCFGIAGNQIIGQGGAETHSTDGGREFNKTLPSGAEDILNKTHFGQPH